MTTIDRFSEIALSFPEVVKKPHFDRSSFRTLNKIFATLDENTTIATFRFSKSDQLVFCSINKTAIYPVPNKWGEQGWTFAELKKIPEELITEMLDTAYNEHRKQV